MQHCLLRLVGMDRRMTPPITWWQHLGGSAQKLLPRYGKSGVQAAMPRSWDDLLFCCGRIERNVTPFPYFEGDNSIIWPKIRTVFERWQHVRQAQVRACLQVDAELPAL